MATRLAALMGLLAVALGAFGAHALKELLARHNAVAVWEKAVFYHFIHAFMLFVLAQRQPVRTGPWVSFFMGGIVVFSGSLGMLTPIGGVSLLLGWAWLLVTAGRQTK
jgi:uncharacterized membrane protein YgdD (TMEM256/DUF423 family)